MLNVATALAERNIYEMYQLFQKPNFWQEATVPDVRKLASEPPGGYHYRVPALEFTFLHGSAAYSKLPVVRPLLDQGLDLLLQNPDLRDSSLRKVVEKAAQGIP